MVVGDLACVLRHALTGRKASVFPPHGTEAVTLLAQQQGLPL